MERAQRNRVPTAKAAENSNIPRQVEQTALQITTPEWSNLPDEPTFYESAKEVSKEAPTTKTSSSTGEKFQLFHLGNHLESQNKYHYTRAKRDKQTDLYHNTEAPPYHARLSDEMHPLCNINEFTMDSAYSRDMLTCWGKGAARTFKANVCAREGTWFYEAKVLSCQSAATPTNILLQRINDIAEGNANNHKGDTDVGAPRIGFARREHHSGHSLGSSGYSYSVNVYGTKNGHDICSGGVMFDIPSLTEIKENDVIGFMITLPSLDEHKSIVLAEKDPNETSASSLATKSKRSKKGRGKAKSKSKQNQDTNPASEETTGASTNHEPIKGVQVPRPSVVDIIHERYPIKHKGGIYFESSEYLQNPELKPGGYQNYKDDKKKVANGRAIPSQDIKFVNAPAHHDWPTLRGLPGSKIELWVNGEYKGIIAKDLLAFLPPASVVDVQKKQSLPANMHSGLWDDGTLGYYPAVSHYASSITEFKFQEPFWYGHDGREGVRAFGKRYDEAIVEDMVSDMIDEIQWEMEHRAAGKV